MYSQTWGCGHILLELFFVNSRNIAVTALLVAGAYTMVVFRMLRRIAARLNKST